MNENNKNQKRIEINLNEKTAQGTYANLEIVTHSHSEFVLDFCQLLPGVAKANVVSRLILSPTHAKALLRTLSANIAKYEENFGQIRELPRQPRPELTLKKDTENIPN